MRYRHNVLIVEHKLGFVHANAGIDRSNINQTTNKVLLLPKDPDASATQIGNFLSGKLKKNISDLWWKDFVEQRIDCVGLDSSIILHPNVWKTSGHIDEFTDPLIECSICQHRSRADKLLEDYGGLKPDIVAKMSLNEMKTQLYYKLISLR